MRQRDPDAAHDEPDDVEYRRKATRVAGYLPHLPAKGSQTKNADFETLHPKRDADNGDTEHEARHHVFDEDNQATEN